MCFLRGRGVYQRQTKRVSSLFEQINKDNNNDSINNKKKVFILSGTMARRAPLPLSFISMVDIGIGQDQQVVPLYL